MGISNANRKDMMKELRRLGDNELVELINSTKDVKLLELAEEEYIRRNVSDEPYLNDPAFDGYGFDEFNPEEET